MLQVPIDELQDIRHHTGVLARLTRQRRHNKILHAEATRDGHHKRNNRHYGKQRVISERRGFDHKTVLRKAAHGQHYGHEHTADYSPGPRRFGDRNSPNVCCEEMRKVLDEVYQPCAERILPVRLT